MSLFSLSTRVAGVAALATAAFFLGRWTTPPASVVPSNRSSSGHAGASDPASTTVSAVSLAAATAPADPRVLRAHVEQLPGSLSAEDARQKDLERWAETDPRAAMDFARSQLKGDRQAQAMSAVLSIWGRHDPAGAWTWVKTEMPTATYHFDTLLEVFGRQSTETAAKYAAEYSAEHPEATLEVHLAALLGVTYRGDFAGARAVVEANRSLDPTVRANLDNFIAGQWGRFAPEQAAAWVESLPAGPQRDQALIGLGESWSDVDPARSAAFAATLPAGEARTVAMRQSIAKWVAEDADAARQWVVQTDRHEDFDQAVQAIATQNNFMYREPDRALRWASTIFDDRLRFQSESTILANLYPRDPKATLAFIDTAPDLTAEQRAELRHQLQSAN